MKKQCQVCEETISKYRCPKCNIEYCSLKCYKVHNEKELCKQQQPQKENIEEVITTATTTSKKEAGTTALLPPSDWQVPEESLATLEKSKEFRDAVSDSRLQAIIRRIDSSENRETELEKEIENNPYFAKFVHQTLMQL